MIVGGEEWAYIKDMKKRGKTNNNYLKKTFTQKNGSERSIMHYAFAL